MRDVTPGQNDILLVLRHRVAPLRGHLPHPVDPVIEGPGYGDKELGYVELLCDAFEATLRAQAAGVIVGPRLTAAEATRNREYQAVTERAAGVARDEAVAVALLAVGAVAA